MNKLLFLLIICLVGYTAFGQFTDDMESYIDGQPISGGHWTDFGCGGGAGCSLMSSSAVAHSGSLSGLIPDDTTTDAVLDLGNKIFGIWHLEFWMYIPSGKEAFFTILGSVPFEPPYIGQFYFNQGNNSSGEGVIHDIAIGDVPFIFPHDEWFRINFTVDISSGIALSTWQLFIDEIELIPCETPFTTESGVIPTTLGGINFFSISSTNTYYVEDFLYWNPPFTCELGLIDNLLEKINIYPNPVKDILTIEINSNIELKSLRLYDVLGRLVLSLESDYDQIDVSGLNNGIFFLYIYTNRGIITKKLIKK